MKKDKLPAGVYHRGNNKNLWISYYDETGKRFRESAKTTDPEVAEALRDKRLREVAEGRINPIKKFESITFGEILDFWWERHGKTKRGFQYKIHRLEKFKS